MVRKRTGGPYNKDRDYYKRRVKRRLTEPGENLNLFDKLDADDLGVREPGEDSDFHIPGEGRHIWCTDVEVFGGEIKAKIWIDEKLYEFVLPHLVWLEKKLIHNTIYNFDQFREYIKDRAKSYKRLK